MHSDARLSNPFEIVVGTYEQYLLGYKVHNIVNVSIFRHVPRVEVRLYDIGEACHKNLKILKKNTNSHISCLYIYTFVALLRLFRMSWRERHIFSPSFHLM